MLTQGAKLRSIQMPFCINSSFILVEFLFFVNAILTCIYVMFYRIFRLKFRIFGLKRSFMLLCAIIVGYYSVSCVFPGLLFWFVCCITE